MGFVAPILFFRWAGQSIGEKIQSMMDGGKTKVINQLSEAAVPPTLESFLNENEASKIIKSSKVITIQDLARQANVKISTANAFLRKAVSEGTVKKVGGFSGHYIYQSASQ